MQTFLFVISLE